MGFLLLNPIENIVASSRAVREKLSKNRSQLCKDHQAQMERLRSIVSEEMHGFYAAKSILPSWRPRSARRKHRFESRVR